MRTSPLRVVELLHRWAGGLIGVVLTVIGLTGALLIHRRLWIMLPHVGDAQDQATARVAQTTARLMSDPAARPSVITYADRDFGLHRLAFKEDAGAYTDQAGHIVARWSAEWQRPELWLLDLHRHLLAGDSGETVAGVAALVGIGLVVTGTILWWRTRRTFAFRLWPGRMSRPAIVRHHRDLGIIVMPLLLLSFITGTRLIFRPLTAVAFGPGAPEQVARMLAGPKVAKRPVADSLDWAGMISTARSRFPRAEIRSLSLPRGRNATIVLRMKQRAEWVPGGRTVIWFAPDTGRIVAARDTLGLPGQARAYNMLFPLHAAEVGGVLYRLVMTISRLSLAMLGGLATWTFWFQGGHKAMRASNRKGRHHRQAAR